MAAETNGEVVWRRGDSASEHDEVWDDTALIEAYDRAVNQVKEEIAQKNTTGSTGSTKKKGKNRKPTKNNQTVSWKVGDYCQAVFLEDGLRYEAYVKEVNEAGTSCLVQYVGYGNEEIVSMSDLFPSLGKESRDRQELSAGQTTQFVPKKNGTSETSSQRSFPARKGRSKRNQNWRSYSHSSQECHAQSQPGSFGSALGPPGGLLSWLKTIVPPQAQTENKAAQPYSCGCMYSGHACQATQQSVHDAVYQAPHHIPPPPFPLDHEHVDNEEALASMLMSWYMSGYHTGFYQALQQSRSSKHGTTCCVHNTK